MKYKGEDKREKRTMASKTGDLRNAIDQAITAGEQFCNVYYDTYDKRRHVLGKLYAEDASVVWNGNNVKGGINEFFTNLPTSEHTIQSLDCQPVSDQCIPGQTTILVVVEGVVKFDGHKVENFSQNFMLTAKGNTVWKVASDCFRFYE